MTTQPAPGSRSPISRLFAAALDGDHQAATTLRALAGTTAYGADALEAARALRALDQRDLEVPGEWIDAEEQARVWATGYVDQLLARYRDEQQPAGQPTVVGQARFEPPGAAWMVQVSEWPEVGARVVVWSERAPSPTPRDPDEGTVDHVAGRTFTVAGLDAVFNRSTGRSKPVRRAAGAFGAETYVAVDADSQRARQVLDTAARRDRDTEATRAVHAWLAERSPANRQAAINALQALNDL